MRTHTRPRSSPRILRAAAGVLAAACALATTVIATTTRAAQAYDPFQFLQPVVRLSADDLRVLDRGEARVRILPAHGREVAVFAIVAARIDADRLLAWVQRIEAMKKSAAVHAIQRFSDPPRLEDLAALSLSADSVGAIRDCRAGDCGLKLSSAEMTRLQSLIHGRRSDWQAPVQNAFRALVLDRVMQYRARGHDGIPAYEDKRPGRHPGQVFTELLGRSRPILDPVGGFTGALTQPPQPPSDDGFLYWSNEQYGGKPVLSVTDVRITRPPPGGSQPLAIVAGKQVFAMHYMNGSLNLTILLRGREGGPNYLVYLNRSEVDVISGMLGGLARAIIERRVRNEAGDVLEALRTRLQGGLPPAR